MGFLNPREAAARGWEGAKNVEGEKYPLIDEEKEVLKMAKKEPRPEIQDFTDVYPQEEVSADKQWLEQQRTREVEVAKTSRGKILETIIRRQAELSNWLGDNCHTVATTEYDDRANHVDFVVEWEKPDGQICRLAVDITTTEDPGIVNKKEELIEEEIERGTLTTVKYFESEADQTKGKIEQLPRVVLAVDRQSIQKLCKDLVREKPKELAKSPEQLLLLKEIRLQMVDQIEYAFALLLENLDQQFKFFSPEEKQELRKLAKSAVGLEQDPNELPKVLKGLDKQKKLLAKIRCLPTIQKYASVISRQREILSLANQLIEEKTEKKSGLLDSSIIQQAAQQENDNVVLQWVKPHLRTFHLPPHLREFASAA